MNLLIVIKKKYDITIHYNYKGKKNIKCPQSLPTNSYHNCKMSPLKTTACRAHISVLVDKMKDIIRGTIIIFKFHNFRHNWPNIIDKFTFLSHIQFLLLLRKQIYNTLFISPLDNSLYNILFRTS
jgi:hypothetical protein